jgi:REP element-mobilizing transposase RayT
VLKRRRSIRLPGYDYSQEGYYFVTICACNRTALFGEIAHGQIQLSNIGLLVERCWYEIPKHFSNVELDTWVIMPNHIHSIIVLDNCRGEACLALRWEP